MAGFEVITEGPLRWHPSGPPQTHFPLLYPIGLDAAAHIPFPSRRHGTLALSGFDYLERNARTARTALP
jgi:hypothetical protein